MVAVRAIGLAILLAASASHAEARLAHPTAAVGGLGEISAGQGADLSFRVTADEEGATGDRWMLDPLDDRFEQNDPYAFRLRLRGAKVKMRMPLDLR